MRFQFEIAVHTLHSWISRRTPSRLASSDHLLRLCLCRTQMTDLPPGWQALQDATGRVFFANHYTQTTQYEDPRPLPPNWQAVTGPDGKTFFANHTTQTTQWDDPRTPIVLGQQPRMEGQQAPVYQ